MTFIGVDRMIESAMKRLTLRGLYALFAIGTAGWIAAWLVFESTCPACSTPALVEGTIDVDWEPDWDYADGESYIAGAYPEVTIFPQRLECRACGLHLEGEAELAAAKVPHSWTLEDVDPDDFQIAVEEGWLDL